MPRKWRGNGGGEDRNCNGVLIKRDLVGEEWENDRQKKLETADGEGCKRSERKTNIGRRNHGQLTSARRH